MWRSKPADPQQIKLLRAVRDRGDLNPMVIHVNYLVNLASADPVIRARSIETFRAELERANAIGADYLVLHPGCSKERSVEEGIAAIVLGMRDAAREIRKHGVTVLLENTAGSGSSIGSRFEELQSIRELARDLTDLPVGYCLDTCHLLAAGFDIVTPAGLRDTIRGMEETLGSSNVHVFHANDSKTPRGSRVDRHENIGEGHIGCQAFRRILTNPKLRRKPFILETPVKNQGDDRRNLDKLKSLSALGRTKATRVITQEQAR
jgi:deoxyribonuclease-4